MVASGEGLLSMMTRTCLTLPARSLPKRTTIGVAAGSGVLAGASMLMSSSPSSPMSRVPYRCPRMFCHAPFAGASVSASAAVALTTNRADSMFQNRFTGFLASYWSSLDPAYPLRTLR